MAYGAIIQGIMGLAGQIQGGKEDEKARKLYQDLLDRINNIPDPELRQQAAVLLDQAEAGQVTSDPQMAAAQRAALAKLQQISDEGGLTLADRAALDTQINRAARAAAAGRNAISNQMAARGQLGSGAELAMNLQAQQQGAQNSYETARDTAATAQQRALQAIMQRGQMAGQMREQDFGERMAAARARDEISRYNAAARERANRYNAGLGQQAFENAMRKAAGGQAATGALAGMHQAEGQGLRNQYAGYGAAAGRAAEEAGDYWDEWQKKQGKGPSSENEEDYDASTDTYYI